MKRRRRRWFGRRSEVNLLLPFALLVLLGLSTFTLFSYRGAVALLIQERQREAGRQARALLTALGTTRDLDATRLREAAARLVPHAQGVAVLDERGHLLLHAGTLAEGDALALVGRSVDAPVGVGPSRRLGAVVVGLTPFAAADGRSYLRLDLPAGVLAGQQRTLPLLTALVLSINFGLFLTVLLYLRQLMAPYDLLLQRARSLVGGARAAEPEAGDEVDFLLATFDRAIDALSQHPDDDIAALERTLAPSLESGLLLLDDRANVLALNAIGAQLLGIGDSVVGQPVAAALAPHPALLDLLREAVDSARGVQRRECVVESGGQSLTLGLTVHPLRRDDGGVRGWLVLFADLTKAEQRARERRLAESLARLGEITAGAAHELRNSLASLRGYLSLLEREQAVAEAGQEHLQEIRHEADHLQRVLDDFLSFARPGSARLETVDIERVARRAASDPSLVNVGVEVRSPAADAPLPRLTGDAQLLERALRNLVLNAAQAQSDSPAAEVTIRFSAGADELRVMVEDRGPGVPALLRPRLFLPFASGRAGGVGLGLALTHRIVDLHGGRVSLEDREGGGTMAVITFPADRFATEGNEPATEEGLALPT